MASNEVEDMDALLAQMEKEYEEEEKRKKNEKRKKKGGKEEAVNEAEVKNEDDKAEKQDEKENIKDKKDKKKKKKDDEKKPEKNDETKQNDKKTEVLTETQQKKEPEATTKETKDDAKKDKKKKTEKKADQAVKQADTKPAEKPAEETKPESASGGEKKKDDKKKPGGKKPTGPSKLILEALAKQKIAEDKIEKEEQERLRKEEEARQELLRKQQLEKERREKKKLKEKERIQRKKIEGTYLTKAQREERERAMKQLQALGIQIPQKSEKIDVSSEEAKKTKAKFERQRKAKQQKEGVIESETHDEEVSGEQAQEQEEKPVEPAMVVPEVVIPDRWDEEIEDDKGTDENVNKKNHDESESESEGSDEEDEDESDESSESSEESESDEDDNELTPLERVKLRIKRRHDEYEKERSTDRLRSPVICVLGHVDTGKTKLLDNLRRTRVQEDEAGGITQQIGATNVPFETIDERTKMCRDIYKNTIKLPGLLIIDTPGHEAFKSLRSRGSSLCDIAILVVDIMHGLEQQTLESIKLLVEKKTKFVIALNKIDRLYNWKTFPQLDVIEVLKKQETNTRLEFEKRATDVIVQLAEQGLNAALYYKNPDPKEYISMVPTSARTSDGTGNLIALLIDTCQTVLAQRLSFSNELQCSVLEVKVIPSLGTTIDVCLVNGKLNVCDKIIIAGQEGPIVTQIRGLLLPAPNRDLRTKNNYLPHKEVEGARGIKIAAKELEKAMPGLPLFVARREDEVEYYKRELEFLLQSVLSSIKLSDVGVFVQASTLGSLEALLDFLRTSKVPYAGINIGPIHRLDVTKASIMLEKDPQWAVILGFDVKVDRDVQEMADHAGVKIFTADIIYHLFDKFIGYRDELKQKKREEFKDVAVFPCKLKILPEHIYNARDPIVVGVNVEAGFLKIGTPIVAYVENPTEDSKEKFVDLGRVTSIEFNHNQLQIAKTGTNVCIKIENTTGAAPRLLGRHFTKDDFLMSKISRESIDAVKNYFREEMSKPDWQLIIDLKKLFQIL